MVYEDDLLIEGDGYDIDADYKIALADVRDAIECAIEAASDIDHPGIETLEELLSVTERLISQASGDMDDA